MYELLITLKMKRKICEWTEEHVEEKKAQGKAHFAALNGWTPMTLAELDAYLSIVLMQHMFNISFKQMWSKSKRCCNFQFQKQKFQKKTL